ncbi:MAG: response regulator [Deltaproteobacteria bacterium]|nr:response regulator [Deltaproteobacteria bacterium]
MIAGHTLLLVDDELGILSALRRTLRGEAYRVLTCSDPHEALTILEKENIDLLVSDIDMPGMNGLELIARVKRQYPDVVRILLTGRGTMDSAIQAINEGEVYRFLTKPWDDKELRETIYQALQRLEELRKAAAADRIALRRERLLAELEREHPGIRTVKARDGMYLIDAERVETMAARLEVVDLRALLSG